MHASRSAFSDHTRVARTDLQAFVLADEARIQLRYMQREHERALAKWLVPPLAHTPRQERWSSLIDMPAHQTAKSDVVTWYLEGRQRLSGNLGAPGQSGQYVKV